MSLSTDASVSVSAEGKKEPGTNDSTKFQWDDEFAGKDWSKYEKLVRRLYMTNLFNPVKLGLENMHDMHEALGSPMDQPDVNVIHIAGSNGKGSVALKTANSLRLAGHRVGLFVSPHISSFRERMQVDGVPITEEQVERYLPEIYRICEERNIPATFFELTTALAFSFFANENVDSVVLETGLGGRLDATNVVGRPAVSIITSIGLEHTRILGDTIELIAGEKGGIIKAGRPVLVGNNAPQDVLRRCAEEKGASGFYTCDDVLGGEEGGAISTKDYDDENSRITTAALTLLQRLWDEESETGGKRHKPVLPEHIKEGVKLRPPCRFEEFDVMVDAKDEDGKSIQKEVKVILDVAHNPQAMENLIAKLEASHPTPKKRIVVGMSADKDLAECTNTLLSHVPDPRSIHLVEACHPRAASIEAILAANPKLRESRFEGEGGGDASVASQVRAALKLAAVEDEMLVVCGSVFIMADAREQLGIVEPRDSAVIAEVAGAGLRSSQENFGDSSQKNKRKES